MSTSCLPLYKYLPIPGPIGIAGPTGPTGRGSTGVTGPLGPTGQPRYW